MTSITATFLRCPMLLQTPGEHTVPSWENWARGPVSQVFPNDVCASHAGARTPGPSVGGPTSSICYQTLAAGMTCVGSDLLPGIGAMPEPAHAGLRIIRNPL